MSANRAESEERSLRAELLVRLTPGLTHEIRGPLTTISGVSQVVANDTRLPDDLRAYMQLVQSQVERVDHLLGVISSFARGGRNNELLPVPVSELIDQVLTLVAHALHERGIEPIAEIEKDTPATSSDSHLVEVLTLLLMDLIEAHDDVRRLTIRTTAADGQRTAITIEALGDDDAPVALTADARCTQLAQDLGIAMTAPGERAPGSVTIFAPDFRD